VVAIAAQGRVKKLHLVHHHLDQSDEDIDRKLAQAEAHRRRLGATFTVLAPAEGTEFTLRRSREARALTKTSLAAASDQRAQS
jgi:hypothetical protein